MSSIEQKKMKKHKNVELHRMTTRSKKNKIDIGKKDNLTELISTLTKPMKVVLNPIRLNPNELHNYCGENIKKKVNDDEGQLIKPTFVEGDIVWAKMRGFPSWPAKIIDVLQGENMVNLIFYGDKTRAKMFLTTIKPFDDGAKNFQPSNRILLNKAVKEALFEKFHQHVNFN